MHIFVKTPANFVFYNNLGFDLFKLSISYVFLHIMCPKYCKHITHQLTLEFRVINESFTTFYIFTPEYLTHYTKLIK